MSQSLTLELPDDVYAKLTVAARLHAKPIAEVAAWHLGQAMTVKPARTFDPGTANGESLKPGESLMQWAGSCDSGPPNEAGAQPGESLRKPLGRSISAT